MAQRGQSSRYSANKKKEMAEYPSKFYMYGVTDGTFKTAATLRDYIAGSSFIPIGTEYYQKEGSNRRYVKKKGLLKTNLISFCTTQLRKDRKRHLKPFIEAFQELDFEAQSAFLSTNSSGFKPGTEQLKTWANDGFELSQIIDLFAGRSGGLKASLGVSAGVWSSLSMLVREVILGNIKMASADNSSDNIANDSIDEQKAEQKNESADSEMTSTNSIKKEITVANCHIIAEIPRKEKESSSNFGSRSRQGRCNPYFKPADSIDPPRIYRALKKSEIDTFKRINGTNGTIFMDTSSDPWLLGLCLLNLALLYEHKCTKMHSRFMCGSDIIQRVLQRKRVKPEWQRQRPSGKIEWQYITVLAEYLKMIVPVSNELSAYEKNQSLMTNDEFSEDYTIGDTNCDYEGQYCRLPRSKSRMEAQKKEKKFRSVARVFWIRTDLAKVKAKMTEEQWTQHLQKLKDCKVLSYMQQYMSIFFRNKEEEYKIIGLIEEDESEKENLFENEIEKEKNEKELLDLI